MSRDVITPAAWRLEDVRDVFDAPLLELVSRASEVHRAHHDPAEVQVNQLISVKTGGCPEDCAYCAQSARYATGIEASALMDREEVLAIATRARDAGVSRVCLGAAWRKVRDNAAFDDVLDMVRSVTDLGLEVCCTLGMLTEAQAKRLEDAGLFAYNHNLDTSREYYETIITTRTYQDRLDTIESLRRTKVTLCCGGIIGMGESRDDRIALLHELATLDPPPESVPINVLSKVPGTPMADQPDLPVWEVVRTIAVARILMPRSMVRLGAGRQGMSPAEQALCFLAGANSIFTSETGSMLTEAVPSPIHESDGRLLDALGLRPRRRHSANKCLPI